MPKTEIKYDARLELTLEGELKQAVIEFAKQNGVSTNEAIRQAIRVMISPTAPQFYGKAMAEYLGSSQT